VMAQQCSPGRPAASADAAEPPSIGDIVSCSFTSSIMVDLQPISVRASTVRNQTSLRPLVLGLTVMAGFRSRGVRS
jgi:hypothetical protein